MCTSLKIVNPLLKVNRPCRDRPSNTADKQAGQGRKFSGPGWAIKSGPVHTSTPES